MVSQPPQSSTNRPPWATVGNKVSPPSAKSYVAPTSHRKLIERKDYKVLTRDSIALKVTVSICAKSVPS